MRSVLLGALLAALLAPAAASARTTLGNWDLPAQRTAARAGLLAGGNGAAPLSAPALNRALAGLARRAGASAVRVGAAPTVESFDAAVVRQLGLGDAAAAAQREAARAGLRPPARFGTEVAARMLGLRHDFPSGLDRLELFPWDRITRAEAAWSLAQVLGAGDWAVSSVRDTLAAFRLPGYSGGQRTALRIAVSRIGYPYVWGGESDTTASVYGPQAHGGFDCSGFVWRVFKLSGLAAGRHIGGRTADAMAKETPRRGRLPLARIRGGDVLFFGTRSYVGHTGIALSRHFMIHSSGQGVEVSSLDGDWYRSEFVWGRRLL